MPQPIAKDISAGRSSRPSRIRLIIRGDDAGSSETANRAIALACKADSLRNVSVMACGPAFDHAVDLLRDLPGICFGLHITLNSEWPDRRWGPVAGAQKCRSLVQADGTFRAKPSDHHHSRFSLDEAITEAKAQLDRMRRCGILPVYLDEHMGVGWLPGLRDALADLAKAERLHDVERAHFRQVRRRPDEICQDATSFVGLLHGVQEGTHLYITHPDYSLTDRIWPGGEWDAKSRDADRRLLLDSDFGPVLRSAGVELTTYHEAILRSERDRRSPQMAAGF